MLDSPRESIKKFGSELHSHNSHHLHFHRHSSEGGNDTAGSKQVVNLAQQYEQDKQKLIKYCFSRYEPDGTLHESYITHVRIIEDSHYPSSRPPATLAASHKKTRILSLAVKRSGTVRLHKGRENPNGSFQIGRTWNLDELSEMQIDKVSDCGMLAVLGKPYYWETNTPKERTVFVKSVCNIYNKFTKGGLPILVDFDQKVFGDILALGNHGKPPTLRYTNSGNVPSSVEQPVASHTSVASAVRSSLANSTYSNNKNSVISARSDTNVMLSPNSLVSPGNNGPLKSPVNARDNSFNKSLKPVQSLQSNKVPPLQNNKQPPLQNNNEKPSLSRLNTQSSEQNTGPLTPNSAPKFKQFQSPLAPSDQRNGRNSPPIAFKSPSMTRLDSPKLRTENPPALSFKTLSPKLYSKANDSETRAALKNDILEDAAPVIDRGVLKSELNSFDNNGIDDKARNHLSPGKIFDSPTNASFENTSNNIASNRSSVIDVEFKNASQRNSMREEDDDTAVVMSEIYKQRSLNKKPSMRFKKSSSNLNADAAASSGADVPPPPPPLITAPETYDSGVDMHDDDTDTQGVYDDDIESKGIYDDNVIEVPVETKDKRQSMGTRKEETTPLEELFEEIEWNSRDDSKNITQKLMRTLLKTEYESVNSLVNISSNFGEIDRYIEESIQQCEKLDPMLTFFQVELDGFSEEISYIESQASGLQVTTANKKSLWNDLKDIISNVSLSNDELKVLNSYRISRNEHDIISIENVLSSLYSALKTIRGVDDKESGLANQPSSISNDLGNMRALTERNKVYEKYSESFLVGVENALSGEFKHLYREMDNLIRQALGDSMGRSFDVSSLIRSLNKEFSCLLVYGGFTLFAKEIAQERFYAIMNSYQHFLRRSFNELIENILKFNTKILTKILGSKFSYKFSFDYKINRSNMLIDEGKGISEKNIMSIFDLEFTELIFDKINGVIELLVNLIVQQQSFVGEFFHLSSLNEVSLEDYLKTFPRPNDRVAAFLKRKQNHIINKHDDETAESDKSFSLIENIFIDQIIATIKFLTDFATKHIQIVPALILVIDHQIELLAAQNNDFVISNFLKKISNRYKNIWYNYSQNQGKIFANNISSNFLIDKKIGILFVIKAYPQMVKLVEKSLKLSQLDKEEIESNSVRLILDTTYDDYNRYVLKTFQSTYSSIVSSAKNKRKSKLKKDIEDDEANLNKCVNLIANSNYLLETFEKYDSISIVQFRTTLQNNIYKDCVRYYIDALLQSSLSKLIEFIEGIESLIKNSSRGISDPTKNNTYSKENFRKLTAYYNKQEVHQGIQMSYKKVENDFADYDSGNEAEELLLLRIKERDLGNIKNKLVSKIWKQIETEYILIYKRLEGISNRYYRDVDFEVNRSSLVQMFNSKKSHNGFR